MNDFDDQYKNAVEAGKRNLRTKKLLSNWCFHAEFTRTEGRGMIEAQTGLPIGHMGVQCKFSKKNLRYCWLLEDAVYDFFLNNCKNCKDRVPVGIPNIMSFITLRENAAEKRKSEREEEEWDRKQRQIDRRQEREKLRCELSLEEAFVLDLLDELDQEDIAKNDLRLEQLANLAPEVFTRKVIEHLMPAVLHEYLPYSISAGKALLRAQLEPNEKLSVAVQLVSSNVNSPSAIEVVLSDAEKLSKDDLTKVLHRFASMALEPPPGMYFGGGESLRVDVIPIQLLFKKRRVDIFAEVEALLRNTNPGKVRDSVEVILATDCDELLLKNVNSIFTKLMRRQIFLPGASSDSVLLFYLRKAASKCLERIPEETDKVMQLLLAGNDDTAKEEAFRTYRSILKRNFNQKVEIGTAQRIAFGRLLWAAIESPENYMDEAGQFFRHSSEEFSELAAEHFNDLIGAAATLSDKYEQIDTEKSLEVVNNVLAQIQIINKRTAVHNLQDGLLKWAVIGAKFKGNKGIEDFLKIYRNFPEDQTQIRGNMIVHISELLTDVESLTLVLSDWYRALMDKSTEVRASAVKAWENVPIDLVKNFPDLFFESISILLTDPYIIVHRSVVHSLIRRPFPEGKYNLIKIGLWNLILYYTQESKQEEFIVDCIDVFAFQCLSTEEIQGSFGKLLSAILFSLEGNALYHAINRLHLDFANVPGFTKVVLKSIKDATTRSISIDACALSILRASGNALKSSVDEIVKAFEALRPFKSEEFSEALLYAFALTKAGNYALASTCFRDLIARIPLEVRYEQWRLKAKLVAEASAIEQAIQNSEPIGDLTNKWNSIKSELENEYEERAKFRDFPPSIFFKDKDY
ncbi:MAG: hypothetical protein RBR15_10305 [Sphaerochaeta sp.]|nr:hypothetical protein [Sphaerochaeta sp.]